MIVQRFLRGIRIPTVSSTRTGREEVLTRTGLWSAWLREKGPCDPEARNGVVDDDALVWHVSCSRTPVTRSVARVPSDLQCLSVEGIAVVEWTRADLGS